MVREKKIFRSLVGEVDLKKSPTAITDYLEKHFKQKEAMKKQKQMMGGDEDELRARIRRMDEVGAQIQKKKIDTTEFKAKREMAMGSGTSENSSKDKEDKYI